MEQEENYSADLLSEKDLLQTGVDEEVRTQFYTIITWGKIMAVVNLSILAINVISFVYRWQTRYLYRSFRSLLVEAISWVMIVALNYWLLQFCIRLRSSLDDEDQDKFVLAASGLKMYMVLLFTWLTISFLLGVVSGAMTILHL